MPIAVSRGQALRGIRPVVDGGTGASDAVTALSNLGAVGTSDHPTLHTDDSIILNGKFTVVNPTTVPTAVALNTAIQNFQYVFMEIGNYNYGNEVFNIFLPTGHHLIGLSQGRDIDPFNYRAYFTLNINTSSARTINIPPGGSIRNIGWNVTGAVNNSNPFVEDTNGSGMRLAENLYFKYNGVNTLLMNAVRFNSGGVVRNCVAEGIDNANNCDGVFNVWGNTGLGVSQGHGCYGCTVSFELAGGSGTTSGIAFQLRYANAIDCHAYRANGHGFYLTQTGNNVMRIQNCMAYQCEGSGFFNFSSAGGSTGWITVHNNKAVLNGDYGFYFPFGLSTYKSGYASNNYANSNNQNASGSVDHLYNPSFHSQQNLT